MQLRVVYRSTGAENKKPRPAYYSKTLALFSFLRAVERCPEEIDVVYLNDGPIPPDRLELMESTGTIISGNFGAMPGRSVRMLQACLAALAVPDQQGWPDNDLVYFVEDDYLHLPDSLSELLEAVRTFRGGSYFGLYGLLLGNQRAEVSTSTRQWYLGHSTTYTFAVRLGVLRRDRRIHRLGCETVGAFDRNICLCYRGVPPFPWREVMDELRGRSQWGRSGRRKRLRRSFIEACLNVLAIRRSIHPHLLLLPNPRLATHLETPGLPSGIDWEAVAEQTQSWLAKRVAGKEGYSGEKLRGRT